MPALRAAALGHGTRAHSQTLTPRMRSAVRLLACHVLLGARVAAALDNGVGQRPPLGWSSWNHFAARINADILKQTADAMVKHGLRDAGYEYLNLDDGWAVNRTAEGVLIADPVLFPPSAPGANDGIKIVADYVHARNLKFGICAFSSLL